MWRGLPLVLAAAACGQRTGARPQTIHIDEAVTVSSDLERVEGAIAPAITVDARGLLIAWQVQRRSEEQATRIYARRVTHDLQPVGAPIEVGLGSRPVAIVSSKEYVVGWTEGADAEQPITVARIADDGSISETRVVRGVATVGTTALVMNDDAVTVIGCSDDFQKLIVAREFQGSFAVEQRPMRDGCNDVATSVGNDTIALIHPSVVPRTEIVELSSTPEKPRLVDADCFDAIPLGGALSLVCLDGESRNRFVYWRYQRGSSVPLEHVPIDVRTKTNVVEAHATPLGKGIFIAWTTETTVGFQLSGALVDANGHLLVPETILHPAPLPARFDVTAMGSSAWLAFVAERQLSDSRYQDNVVVTRVRLTGM